MPVWPLHGETCLENGDSMSTIWPPYVYYAVAMSFPDLGWLRQEPFPDRRWLWFVVCQRIDNIASFFCQHSMHIFIKTHHPGSPTWSRGASRRQTPSPRWCRCSRSAISTRQKTPLYLERSWAKYLSPKEAIPLSFDPRCKGRRDGGFLTESFLQVKWKDYLN